jgi:FtsH-binding integral membrane protein
MNAILWIIQIILAIKLLSVAWSHGVRQDQAKMQTGIRRMGGSARPVLYAVAAGSLILGIGLIVPAAASVPTWVVPLSAGILAAGMALSILFHRACRENPNIIPSLVLLVFAAFVAYGRMILVPFE